MSRLPLVKASLFGLGLAVGLAGMALRFLWMVGVAVGLLAAAFALRFVERKPEPDEVRRP